MGVRWVSAGWLSMWSPSWISWMRWAQQANSPSTAQIRTSAVRTSSPSPITSPANDGAEGRPAARRHRHARRQARIGFDVARRDIEPSARRDEPKHVVTLAETRRESQPTSTNRRAGAFKLTTVTQSALSPRAGGSRGDARPRASQRGADREARAARRTRPRQKTPTMIGVLGMR